MAAASSSTAAPTVDAAIWQAVAGASVQIPPPNSYVYYFPQGHLEQCGAQITNYTPVRPFILCRVLSVGLSYHPLSDQPFAKILLQPEPDALRHRQQQRPDARKADGVVSYSKVLTPSDANNGGGFSVPRSCADLVFPPLDFAADPPVQNLTIRDARGNAWEFRHIYRGTPRRHLLTTGWSKFVNAKRLIAGESVVFARKPGSTPASPSELFIGIRRAGKVISSWKSGGRSAANGGVELEAMEKAAKGAAFEVEYYPRVGSPDFVVSAEKVEEAFRIPWGRGMRVKMEVETDDSTRMASSEGTIKEVVLPDSGPWQGSPWKMLRVTWDEPDVILNAEVVNPWDVDNISPASHLCPEFPPAKKFKLSPEVQQGMPTELDYLPVHHNHSRTFTQLLTDCNEPEMNLFSEIMSLHSGGFTAAGSQSSSGGEGSFRLFGQTIRKSEEGLKK